MYENEINNVNENADFINDFDWSHLSIGSLSSNTMCDNFFGKRHIEHEREFNKFSNENNDFEDINKANVENNQNLDNIQNKQQNSLGSSKTTSSDSNVNSVKCNGTNTKKLFQSEKKTTVPKDFNVVYAAKLSEEKRKLRMKEIERKEREQRIFHSKPAPNFQAIHASQNQRRTNDEPKITIPVTPKVVHNHLKSMERIRSKQKQFEEANKPKPFISHEAEVLIKKPFVPQIKKKPHTEPIPFNLHGEERMRERRQFDEQVKREIERKQKEEDERRKAEEEQLRREIRKAITFKARPNPFS